MLVSMFSVLLPIYNDISFFFFFSSRRRHTRFDCDWSSDVCSSDLLLRHLSPPAIVGRLVTVIGALLGLYVAGYTGVLLAVTNRPIWADTTLLGLTFLISAASTSAALLILLGSWGNVAADSVDALERFDASVLVLEAAVIAALIASLGRIAMVWLNGWGLLLAVMVLGGIALPLYMRWRARGPRWALRPALILLGGLILRAVIVFSSDPIT